MNPSYECPLDIEKVLSQCGYPGLNAFHPLKWRCVVSLENRQHATVRGRVEVAIIGNDGSKHFILCAEQEWSGEWRVKSIKIPAYETNEAEREAIRILGRLKEDDYWDDVKFVREYEHCPTEHDVLDFLRWAWRPLPKGYAVKWEGSAVL